MRCIFLQIILCRYGLWIFQLPPPHKKQCTRKVHPVCCSQFICSESRILPGGMFTILGEDEATYQNTCFDGPLICMMTIFSKSNTQEVQNTHLHLMPGSWMCAVLFPNPLKHFNAQVHDKLPVSLHSIIIYLSTDSAIHEDFHCYRKKKSSVFWDIIPYSPLKVKKLDGIISQKTDLAQTL
jgi:hypothetical protein